MMQLIPSCLQVLSVTGKSCPPQHSLEQQCEASSLLLGPGTAGPEDQALWSQPLGASELVSAHMFWEGYSQL